MIRPFYDEKMRVVLPYTDKDKALYSQLSKWLIHTAGHPRRLQTLFKAMNEFPFAEESLARMADETLRLDERMQEGRKFVDQLATWLKESSPYGKLREKEIEDSITDEVPFPSSLEVLSSGPLRQTIESLVMDTVRPFQLQGSSDVKDSANHLPTLDGAEYGFCFMLEQSAGRFLSFIPFPVFEIFPRTRSDKKLGPCGEAFCDMADAIKNLHEVQEKDDRGKAFEKVVARSVLLYTRCNEFFSPTVFCLENHGGDFQTVELRGGENIQYVEMDETFPPDGCDRLKEQDVREFLVRIFERKSCGAIVVSLDKHNLVGGYYGVFRCATRDNHWFVIAFQNNEWFKDTVKEKEVETTIFDKWTQFQSVFPKDLMTVKDVHGVNVTVQFLHILQSSTEVTMEFKCDKNQGMGTIAQMRQWNPAAAYACENAMAMRKIFAEFPVK